MGKGQRLRREQEEALRQPPVSNCFNPNVNAPSFMPGGNNSNTLPPPVPNSDNGLGLGVKKVGSLSDLLQVGGDAESVMSTFSDLDETNRITSIDDLAAAVDGCSLVDFELGNKSSSRAAIAHDLCDIVINFDLESIEGQHVINVMITQIQSKSAAREAGLILFDKLIDTFGKRMEPYVLPILQDLLRHWCDRSPVIKDLASTICTKLISLLNKYMFRPIYDVLTKCLTEDDWKIKISALNFLEKISPRMSSQVSPMIPHLIPLVTECMISTKKEVKAAGKEAMLQACKSILNEDISPLVPKLVSVIGNPDETSDTLDALLETVFVATVDAPTLALIGPLLGKALRTRSSALKRKAARVIDSMCRLVQNPHDVAPFEPMLLPALDRVIDEIADAEVCQVAKDARNILVKAMGDAKAGKIDAAITDVINRSPAGLIIKNVHEEILNIITNVIDSDSPYTENVQIYMAQLLSHFIVYSTNPNTDTENPGTFAAAVAMTDHNDFNDCIIPFLRTNSSSETEVLNFAKEIRKIALGTEKDQTIEDDNEEGLLCNFEFSLAFGGKILLHSSKLRLKRGRRYGVMGKNGAGKTTLLTNIGTGNIEGLPQELKTIYVQHDDVTDDMGISLLDELENCKELKEENVQRNSIVKALKDISFTDTMLNSPRSNLSGGWKMKVLIIKAILSNADILLLDEPTNHLDAASVKWLIDYLNKADSITCLIVSHDTGFMDNVITDVIHYEEKKLVYYPGNLSQFVKKKPEAKYYYELEDSSLKFVFPTPERLDGINSVTKAVIRMENVTYTYPGASQPTIRNANVKVCLGSRIAILGANGAGKSTLIKMMVQETEPDEGSNGEVWKHHNLRIAYVAQHSFHHVEQHLESSPVDYMKWRFAGGVDRESSQSQNIEKIEASGQIGQKKYGDVTDIIGRRKNGRTLEYECTFHGQTKEENKYYSLEVLQAMGADIAKLVELADAKIAAASAGINLRSLTIKEIQTHLDAFALESEFGTHSKIKRLSGGQKVKLVLAAAMWNSPHILILDEPTNYLDRQAMGALTQAIKGFGGGVVVISHNKEFTDAICEESWNVKDGMVETTGGVNAGKEMKVTSGRIKKESAKRNDNKEKAKDAENERTGNGSGNVNKTIVSEDLINPKTYEKLSKKEIRKLEKCAAGVPLKEYLSKITKTSPEWAWLGKG